MKMKNIVKNVILILIITFKVVVLSQESKSLESNKFQFNESGINDYVIKNIDNKTKEEIYLKSINWIKESYKNPELVLKIQIPNEKLRIDAIAKNLANVGNKNNRVFLDIAYSIEISFKDNKYKFEILSIVVSNIKDLKIQNFKSDQAIKYWGTTSNDIEIYFNSLNQSLEKYILKTKNEEKW